jgi:alpha-tubulin suppressor-like RCC1 family protein
MSRIDCINGGRGGFVQVSVGQFHMCARTEAPAGSLEGNLWCWAWHGEGQLGPRDGTKKVLGITATEDIALTRSRTCAITRATSGAAREIWCWGEEDLGTGGRITADAGTLGDCTDARCMPRKIPLAVPDPVELALGFEHSCVRTKAGAVYCWGSNEWGQLGTGPIDTPCPFSGKNPGDCTLVPQLAIADSVIALRAGRFFTCALMADHTIRCWGANDAGQTGNATNNQREGRPVSVIDPDTLNRPKQEPLVAYDLVAGGAHACARVKGKLLCWGRTVPEIAGTLDHRWPVPVP